MAQSITVSKRSTRSLNKGLGKGSSKGLNQGFTIVELLVSAAIGLVILSIGFSLTIASRDLVQNDQERTSSNQDLRSSVELMANDIRLAGERLTAEGTPAISPIEIKKGNELIVRRNLLEEVLPVCTPSAAFSNGALVSLVDSTGDSSYAECKNETRDKTNPDGTPTNGRNMPDDLERWKAYRVANGGSVRVYFFSPYSKLGEFFTYSRDGYFSANYRIGSTTYNALGWAMVRDNGGGWQHSYSPAEKSRVYMLEERRYRLKEGILEVIVNGDEANPLRIANNVESLSFNAVMTSGSKLTDIETNKDENWRKLAAVEVTLQVDGHALTSKFFPRNVLSQ